MSWELFFVLEIPSSRIRHFNLDLHSFRFWESQNTFQSRQKHRNRFTIPLGIDCQQELRKETKKWSSCVQDNTATVPIKHLLLGAQVQDGPPFAFWIESCERHVSSASSAGHNTKLPSSPTSIPPFVWPPSPREEVFKKKNFKYWMGRSVCPPLLARLQIHSLSNAAPPPTASQ